MPPLLLPAAAAVQAKTAPAVRDKLMINKQRLIRLTQELIKIDSQNPPGDEVRIANFVKSYLYRLGVKSKIYEFKKRRVNLIAILPGQNNKRSLLVTPHLDTVPGGKGWHFAPLDGKIRGDRIYGLGATDCKGNLAVALETITSLVEEKTVLGYDLIFAATSDEESGSILGLAPLLDKGLLKPDAALVLDADDFNIVVAQKGLAHIKVKITGKKAHGAYPWLGENAIDQAIEILGELKKQKTSVPKNSFLRPPTMNIGTIRGGDKVNVVADWCEFELDFRFLPGSRARELLARLKKVIRKHAGKFKIEIEGIQKPYTIDRQHPLVKCLKKAMRKNQIQPLLKGSEGATVISFFQDKKIPALATGFGCEEQAHAADEYVKISNLYKGSFVLADFLKSFNF
jgi:succinyl-diaminopimelate desuccinylase